MVPSSVLCSQLRPALPSGKTMKERALSNQRFALSPCRTRSAAARSSAGVSPSRDRHSSAVSTVSRAAGLAGSISSSARLLRAHSVRSLVVR